MRFAVVFLVLTKYVVNKTGVRVAADPQTRKMRPLVTPRGRLKQVSLSSGEDVLQSLTSSSSCHRLYTKSTSTSTSTPSSAVDHPAIGASLSWVELCQSRHRESCHRFLNAQLPVAPEPNIHATTTSYFQTRHLKTQNRPLLLPIKPYNAIHRLSEPFPGRSIPQRRHFRSSSTVSSFDPLKFPLSANLLKQPSNTDNDDSDEESCVLSPEEIELKSCLQAYQDQRQNITNKRTVDPDLLDQLCQAYMALEYWEEALQVEETKCQWLVDTTYNNDATGTGSDDHADSIHAQGKLWLRQGDFDRSKPLYEQALEYFQQTENRVQEGHVYISLAGWYFFQYEKNAGSPSSLSATSTPSSLLDTAMEYLQLAESRLDSNPTLLVKCLDNQGLIFRLRGDFESALDKYQQALQVVVDDSIRHALQLHVADMMVALEEPHQALALYEELLQECLQQQQEQQQEQQQQEPSTPAIVGMKGVLWHNIATIHVQLGEYDLAEHEFRQSLHCKQESAGSEEHPELAKTWNALGALYYGVLDEKIQALECFRHVLWIARVHSDHSDHSKDPQVLSALQTISDIEEQLDKER